MTRQACEIRIGCSGWTYRHWRGTFYPQNLPARAWFEFYARSFDTVEINNSFYRLPAPETVDKWREQAPPGFRYAVKANRFITQAKKLKDCAEPVARLMAPVRRLGSTLGPILYQLPPRLRIDLDRLDAFLELLPPELDHVFEFREASWLTDETLALLDRRGASLCAHDMPGSATGFCAAGPIAYVRFHGATGKYQGRYPKETLSRWADWMIGEARSGRQVWAYFNNDIHADAVHDALALRSVVSRALCRRP